MPPLQLTLTLTNKHVILHFSIISFIFYCIHILYMWYRIWKESRARSAESNPGRSRQRETALCCTTCATEADTTVFTVLSNANTR